MYATLTEIKAATGREDELCTCIETNTTYKYLAAGSSYTADDKFYLVTGNGGDTRWVGISGKYNVENYIRDINNTLYESNVYLQYNKLDFISESEPYGGTVYDMVTDDEYIYYIGATTNRIYKAYKHNFQFVAQSASFGGALYGLRADSTHLYVVGSNNVQRAYKILKTTLATSASSAVYGSPSALFGIYLDDTHFYVGGYGPNTVVKLLKSNMSTVATSASYGGTIRSITGDDTYIYVVGLTTNRVRKYLKSNLSYVTQSGSYGAGIYCIEIDGTTLYIGTDGEKVCKLSSSDLSAISETSALGDTVYRLKLDGDYIYITFSDDTTVTSFLKSDLSVDTYYENDSSYSGLYIESGYFVYAGDDTGSVHKLALTKMYTSYLKPI